MAEQDWTREIPTEEGPYWFYGWFEGRRVSKTQEPILPMLYFIEVKERLNHSFAYISPVSMQFSGNIAAIGKWKPVVLPELPRLLDLEEQPEKVG